MDTSKLVSYQLPSKTMWISTLYLRILVKILLILVKINAYDEQRMVFKKLMGKPLTSVG